MISKTKQYGRKHEKRYKTKKIDKKTEKNSQY